MKINIVFEENISQDYKDISPQNIKRIDPSAERVDIKFGKYNKKKFWKATK